MVFVVPVCILQDKLVAEVTAWNSPYSQTVLTKELDVLKPFSQFLISHLNGFSPGIKRRCYCTASPIAEQI